MRVRACIERPNPLSIGPTYKERREKTPVATGSMLLPRFVSYYYMTHHNETITKRRPKTGKQNFRFVTVKSIEYTCTSLHGKSKWMNSPFVWTVKWSSYGSCWEWTIEWDDMSTVRFLKVYTTRGTHFPEVNGWQRKGVNEADDLKDTVFLFRSVKNLVTNWQSTTVWSRG